MGQSGGDGSFLEEAFRRRQVSAPQPVVPGESIEPDDPVDPAGDTTPDQPASSAAPDQPADSAAPDQPAGSSTAPAEAATPAGLGAFDRALVEEAMKKSDLIWVRTPSSVGGRALWHTWANGHAYVVTGGEEQPDPGLAERLDPGVNGRQVVVVVRSKDTMNRLLAVTCDVSQVTTEDDDWVIATTELAKARLNLRNAEEAPLRWRDQSTYHVIRLTPTGADLVEGPGAYPSESGRAAPVATGATTAGARPRVLHRRGGSGRRLS